VLVVGGRRRAESPRRLRRLIAPVEPPRDGGVTSAVFVSPLFWWTTEDRDAYQLLRGLPRNPVTEKLCSISGDCLCGAMADQGSELGERRRLAHFYPEMDMRLAALEARARAAGVWYQWGVKPPPSYSRAQRERQVTLFPMYGCTGCEWRAEAEEDARALDAILAEDARLQLAA
jgi:3'-phosphoadenosine 5'-phosphosulfate sulfotransferase (PAPS reductase)/FAD synthetase